MITELRVVVDSTGATRAESSGTTHQATINILHSILKLPILPQQQRPHNIVLGIGGPTSTQ